MDGQVMAESGTKAGAMPGWVEVFIGIGIAVLVVGVIAALSGHGRWQHMGMGGMHQ